MGYSVSGTSGVSNVNRHNIEPGTEKINKEEGENMEMQVLERLAIH